jgi:hypothetical protein
VPLTASLCPQRPSQVLDVSSSGPRFLKNPVHQPIIDGSVPFVQPQQMWPHTDVQANPGAKLNITDLFRLANRASP